MIDALRNHWPEYLMEAACLGVFMISACVFTVLLEHPASPVRQAIVNPLLRLLLIGHMSAIVQHVSVSNCPTPLVAFRIRWQLNHS